MELCRWANRTRHPDKCATRKARKEGTAALDPPTKPLENCREHQPDDQVNPRLLEKVGGEQPVSTVCALIRDRTPDKGDAEVAERSVKLPPQRPTPPLV